ncbi:DUF1772 domain-containing protein [Nitratireductor sp. B36]|uniref:anthrone oxygenase family protein n=1 Tax=Nitratireductor sp. B36 TaxID=2762059 RepID=UPI001E612A20|nr:anthrone oxygenase family protein [Nitratireductor sp. B36]MCC5779181.1 DUF1772 domain-containing protein [Nitratireductor sp. B36]
MRSVTTGLSVVAILFSGAIFGFFYAWVCSTMWGLDQTDPRVAIAAMQAMNASVRNAVFFPAFFLTPVVLALTAFMIRVQGQKAPAFWIAAGAATYLVFGLILTMAVNVPMNEALALVSVPEEIEAAEAIWSEYSSRWQFWNQARTAASAVALALAGYGIARLRTD